MLDVNVCLALLLCSLLANGFMFIAVLFALDWGTRLDKQRIATEQQIYERDFKHQDLLAEVCQFYLAVKKHLPKGLDRDDGNAKE